MLGVLCRGGRVIEPALHVTADRVFAVGGVLAERRLVRIHGSSR